MSDKLREAMSYEREAMSYEQRKEFLERETNGEWHNKPRMIVAL